MPDAADTEILNLRRDFPPVSTEAWEAAIARDLKLPADVQHSSGWHQNTCT